MRATAGLLKRPGVLLTLIICLGLALRLYAAWEMNASRPDTPARLGADEPGYDALARGFLAGEVLTWPGRVPLYPLWLAGLHYATGYSYAAGIYIQSLVGALAVWLTFVLGRRLFGWGVGALAALGAAVDIVLVQQSVRFLSEILFTPLVLAVAISFVKASSRRRQRGLPGRACGLALRTWCGLPSWAFLWWRH